MFRTRHTGFTLAELLIALAILGVNATFTIPKIITAQQNSTYNTIAKEDISAIAGAYQNAQMAGLVSSGTTLGVITQYINYAATDTSTTIDDVTTAGSQTCNATLPCLKMHNSSLIRYRANASFDGTSTTHALWFHIDPDGAYSGTTNGAGKLLVMFIYYNGKIVDEANIPSTTNSYAAYTAAATNTPSWFSW